MKKRFIQFSIVLILIFLGIMFNANNIYAVNFYNTETINEIDLANDELDNQTSINLTLRMPVGNLIEIKSNQMARLALRGNIKMQLSRSYTPGNQTTDFSWNNVSGGKVNTSLTLRYSHGSDIVAISDPATIYAPVEGYYTMRFTSYWTYGGWTPSQYNRTLSTSTLVINGQTFSQTKGLTILGYWYAAVAFDMTQTVYLKAGNNSITNSWLSDYGTLPNGYFNFPFYANIGGSMELRARYTLYQSRNDQAYQALLTTFDLSTQVFTADVAAPNIPTIDLLSIRGNNELIKLKAYSTDNSTKYSHYLSCDVKDTTPSDVVTTNIITGVKGFSYVIDKEKNTIPDANIEFEASGGLTDQVLGEINIDKKYVNSGHYLHIKAIDRAGNEGTTLHILLEYIEKELNLEKNYKAEDKLDTRGIASIAGWNYVDLKWKLKEIYPDGTEKTDTYSRYNYKIYYRKEGETNYKERQNGQAENVRMEQAKDLAGPDRPIVNITEDKNVLKMKIRASDKSTAYEFYVRATAIRNGEEIDSNTVVQEVKTGVKGFAWKIDTNSNTDPGNSISNFPETLGKENIGKWLHIRAIDWAGNLGTVLHIKIDSGRYIPEEELDQNKNLFCIQYGQEIPAKEDQNYLNATVTAGRGEYKFTQVVENPQTGDIIGRRFVEGVTNNIYGTRDIYSYSIGKYIVSMDTPDRKPNKEGNADEKEAYIFSFYEQNNSLSSAVQKALYSADLSKDNIRWDWDETPESQAIKTEAEAYAAYREAGYQYRHIDKKVECYMDYDWNILVGPYMLDYTPQGIQIKGINREPVYFCNIVGAKIYDQNGRVIGEKDKYGNNIGTLQWEFVYPDNQTVAKRADPLFTHDKYKFPVGNEEFYIKLQSDTMLDNITGISKIEFIHQELIADAQYTILEGTYNKVRWTPNRITKDDKDILWCTQVQDTGVTQCVHGMRESNHIVGCYFYLTATILKSDSNKTSQKLAEVEWAKKYYKTSIQTIKANSNNGGSNNGGGDNGGGDNGGGDNGGGDNGGEDIWKITMDFSGSVWNDGLEDANNGVKEVEEPGIEKIQVKLYRTDSNGNRLNKVYSTYTDSNGDYKIKNVMAGRYEIEFEYDGQTYKTTKLLANGNITDYKKGTDKTKFANNSIALETNEERINFNKKFEEIAGNNSAYGTSGRISLEYKSENGKPTLVTLRDGYVKDEFKLMARTSTNDIYYPIVEKKVINGQEYIKIEDVKDANLGLAQRKQTDENLKMDVYESTFSMKDITQSFLHAQRNIRDKNNIKDIESYTQYVNRADYNWRWDESIKDIWQTAGECEMEAYVDYMIVIRNEGEKDFVKISELADYYDKSLEYANQYRDFNITSWAVVKDEKATESVEQKHSEKIKVDWQENSKYEGINNPYSNYYNKMYTNSLEQLELKKGEYLELHIIFRVAKDADRNIKLDQTGEGKKNFAEINGYKTYYVEDRSAAGLVDSNSKPGNLNPLKDKSTYEDDEDKAPDYKLKLDSTTNGEGGTDGSGSKDENEDGKITVDENGITRDEDGNIVGYGNVIEGSVWEDLRTGNYTKELENRQIIADGIRQKDEPLVDYVLVELMETLENKKTGATKTIKVQEQRTTIVLSLSNEQKLGGSYRFDNLVTGKYNIKFTYGQEEQLKENTKYNGQDYQGVSTEDIYKNEELTRAYDNIEIILNLDHSNSMLGESLEKTKKAAQKLVENLMTKMPGVKIGVVSFNNEAQNLIKPSDDVNKVKKAINSLTAGGDTSIGKGIEEAIGSYSKDIDKKIMILLTDGEETIENNETVIRQIEKATDENEIELISILTKEQEQIFGTSEKPRRGVVYRIEQENIDTEITQTIYEEALELSVIKKDRSYGKDIEGDENTVGTRIYNMHQQEKITVVNGERLDLNTINEMTGTEKASAIKAFAQETYMTACTGRVEFKANNTGKSKIEQVNLALRERPKVELKLDSKIEDIKVTLSDGNVIIDTSKGITKNVMGLAQAEQDKNIPISIYMDEEIMHGAMITVKYKVKIANTGEIDRMSNYITGASDETVTTQANLVFNYTGKNTLYREDNQEENIWQEVKNNGEEAKKYISEQARDELGKDTKILKTEAFKAELYPEGSIEANQANNENTYIEKTITLSKVITPQDSTATLTYDSAMEIVERQNEAGRKSDRSVPGNWPYKQEPDSSIANQIIVTKPLGEQRATYYVIAVAILIVLALGIVGIKLTLQKKNDKKEIYK